MTHTPGPWAYDGVRVYAPAFDEPFLVTPIDGEAFEHRGGLIALVYAPKGAPREAQRANAQLITAAPAMHDALEAIWRFVEASDIGALEQAEIRDLIAAALDAAEGPYPRVGTP